MSKPSPKWTRDVTWRDVTWRELHLLIQVLSKESQNGAINRGICSQIQILSALGS